MDNEVTPSDPPARTNLQPQEQPANESEHTKRGKEYGLTPEQSKALSLYL